MLCSNRPTKFNIESIYTQWPIKCRFIKIFILKPVWSCFVLECASTMNRACRVSCQEASAQITNICMANSSPTFTPKPYLTVFDILLVSFAITLNHRHTVLLHINTLACVKVKI